MGTDWARLFSLTDFKFSTTLLEYIQSSSLHIKALVDIIYSLIIIQTLSAKHYLLSKLGASVASELWLLRDLSDLNKHLWSVQIWCPARGTDKYTPLLPTSIASCPITLFEILNGSGVCTLWHVHSVWGSGWRRGSRDSDYPRLSHEPRCCVKTVEERAKRGVCGSMQSIYIKIDFGRNTAEAWGFLSEVRASKT